MTKLFIKKKHAGLYKRSANSLEKDGTPPFLLVISGLQLRYHLKRILCLCILSNISWDSIIRLGNIY